jgi:hypothetical protein
MSCSIAFTTFDEPVEEESSVGNIKSMVQDHQHSARLSTKAKMDNSR